MTQPVALARSVAASAIFFDTFAEIVRLFEPSSFWGIAVAFAICNVVLWCFLIGTSCYSQAKASEDAR